MDKETEEKILAEMLGHIKDTSKKRIRRLTSIRIMMRLASFLFVLITFFSITGIQNIGQTSSIIFTISSIIGYLASDSFVRYADNAIQNERTGQTGINAWSDSIGKKNKWK